MKKYQYILFDLDGTLTDSKPGIIRCVQYSLEKMGRNVPPEEQLRDFLGPPLIVSYQKFFGMNEEEAKKAVSIYREQYAVTGLFENAVYKGIPEALGKLKEHGLVLAIATSKPETYLVRILEHFQLNPYFSVVSGSGLLGGRDTKAEVIEDALCQLAVWKSGGKKICKESYGTSYRGQEVDQKLLEEIKNFAIMVGDRHYDIEGAAACGIDSLGIHYGYASEGELTAAGANYEVEDIDEMCNFFLKGK